MPDDETWMKERLFPHELYELWWDQQDRRREKAFDWWREILSAPTVQPQIPAGSVPGG